MISFCHYGNENMASFRYRAMIPAREMRATINDAQADTLIFAKPTDEDVDHVATAHSLGKYVIADYCDMHFDRPFYSAILQMADAVTCPTRWMSDFIREEFGIEASVVPDPYEFDEVEPHCNGGKLLWFGHALNINSLERVMPLLGGMEVAIVSNIDGAIPWSIQAVQEQMEIADIVLIPETAPYKSPNRTLEAIRRGCFVVAEPHPALNDIPGIWIGNIRKGIEWASHNPQDANLRTKKAQEFVRKTYSPRIQADAWRTAIQKAQSSSTSAVATFSGMAG